MIIDSTYFKGPLTLAQLGQQSVEDNLNIFIEQYEPEFLSKSLGYALSQSLIEGIDVGSGDIEQKWLDLLNGVQFTNTAGRARKWIGFASEVFSPIAAYVYWYFQRDKATNTTGSGEVKAQNENSSTVSPANKMNNAWNEMVKHLEVLWQFLEVSEAYTDYRYEDIDRGGLCFKNPFL